MDESLTNFGGQSAMTGGYDSPKMVRQPTLKERLTLSVEQAERKLADVKRAKEIFDNNPELEELLNIMQRGNF